MGSRSASRRRSVSAGSAVCSSGRSFRRLLVRRSSTSNSACSQIETPLALMSARVSAFMKAPPPVAEHLRAAFQQAGDHARLAAAEIRPRRGGRKCRQCSCRRPSRSRRRHRQRGCQARGEPAADRRLADPHHADKHDRAAARAGQDARPSGQVGIILQSNVRHLQQARNQLNGGQPALSRRARKQPVRRTTCQAAPNMIVLGPVRRHQWGGNRAIRMARDDHRSAPSVILCSGTFLHSGFRIEIAESEPQRLANSESGHEPMPSLSASSP